MGKAWTGRQCHLCSSRSGAADCSGDSSEMTGKDGVVQLAEVSTLFLGNQSWCLGKLVPNFDSDQLWSFGIEI